MRTEFVELIKQNLGKPFEGHVKGFTEWLNIAADSISDNGDVHVLFKVREDMLNSYGVVHGGALSAMMDEAMGFQLFLKSEDTQAYLAMNLTVDFTRSAKLGEELIAKPEVMKKGRRTATMRCTLENRAGKIIAQGTSNFIQMS